MGDEGEAVGRLDGWKDAEGVNVGVADVDVPGRGISVDDAVGMGASGVLEERGVLVAEPGDDDPAFVVGTGEVLDASLVVEIPAVVEGDITGVSVVVVGMGALVDTESVERATELDPSLLTVGSGDGPDGMLVTSVVGTVDFVSIMVLGPPVVGTAVVPESGNVLDRPVGKVKVGTALLLLFPYVGVV